MKGMKESHSEEPATHTGPESCVLTREGRMADRRLEGEALTGVRIGRVLSRESLHKRGGRRLATVGRQHECARKGWSNTRRACSRSSAVLDPEHVRNHLARELGGLTFDSAARWAAGSAIRIREEQGIDARA